MRKLLPLFLVLLLIILLVRFFIFRSHNQKLISQSLPTLNTTFQPGAKTELPHYDHIVVLVMENKTYAEIIGNTSAPFLNSLADNNSVAANYFAITHPSLPNYLALIGGDTFGITLDCTNCFIDKPNLADNLEKAKKNWKVYVESMPKPCFVGDNPPYAQKHNPFIYFNDIRQNKDRCQNIVPLTELSKDLTNPLTTPNFIFISPDLCHDMHDCTIKVGDDWLSQEIPTILNSPAFKIQKSLLVVTWDEASGSGSNQVPTILVGSHVKPKFVSQNKYDHYSLLHTVEAIWDLPTLAENDQSSSVMSEFFN